MNTLKYLVTGGLAALMTACAPTSNDHEEQVSDAYAQEGRASYYANMLHGRKMANGDRYDRTELTAAHRRLPLGTRLEVTNLANDSCVVVTVTDRGPYHGRRILDLSRSAARELDLIEEGTSRVRIEVIEPAPGYDLDDSVAVDRRPDASL